MRALSRGISHLLTISILLVMCSSGALRAAEESPRLLDQRPEYDLIWIESEGREAPLKTELLDFPSGEHVVPDPLPKSGSLELRRLGKADTSYTLPWAKIRRIELWEQMLLDEAIRLTQEKDFAQAFEYFSYLHNYYPRLAGLESATQTHLLAEARHAFQAQQLNDSLFILMALYERNPSHPALASAVPAISDHIIEKRWRDKAYSDARRTLDLVSRAFSKLELKNIAAWEKRFEESATALMQQAEAAFRKEDFAAARADVRAARNILPTVAGSAELLNRIQQAAPEIVTGVAEFAAASGASSLTWASTRTAGLTDPELVELAKSGGDGDGGASYRFRWGDLDTDDEGEETTLRFSPRALQEGLSPARVSLRVLEMANASSRRYQPELANLLDYVSLGEGESVYLRWKRPYVRPEALLRTPLRGLALNQNADSPLWFTPKLSQQQGRWQTAYARAPGTAGEGPRFVVEKLFANDEEALGALASGEIDALDRAPPWQLDRLKKMDGISIGRYALPTVHVLAVNWGRPILDLREFRRALCFAIDRPAIVEKVMLGGTSRSGFRPLSGPFPAGTGVTDPIAYAYKPELAVRPYEPTLARALAAMAKGALAKKEAAVRKAEAAKRQKDEAAEGGGEQEPPNTADQHQVPQAPSQALVLLHSTDPLARLACQSIKLYLDQAGIPITLRELPPDASLAATPHDLRYVELCVWEPLVDARRLLGPGGVAGRSSAYMNLALNRLERAANWNEATTRLHDIHEIAHFDLPLIPLWQTENYFAHRDALQNVGREPVTLYQNVAQWKKEYQLQGARP